MPVQQLNPVEWLAQADPEPEHAFNWWLQHPDEIAFIPAGRLFDAVKVGVARAQRLRGTLVGRMAGPVYTNADNATTYFLVPPGTAQTWPPSTDAECIGEGQWLWVPVPTRIRRDHSYWEQPPDGSGILHSPQVLLAALAALREPEP